MTDIVVAVTEDGADDVRLDDLGRLLRDELLQLPEATAVEALAAGEAPPGTRGALVAEAGALVVTAQPYAAAMLTIVGSVWRWLKRGDGAKRTIRLEVDGDVIELSGASTEVQEKLVEEWIARHAAEG
ncbi:hypothetical protein GON03_03690 [Nocardioides sp. MAH-18]|uniref:Uncharacterized protein n=1 Tax=Nocardioides agri TaxID=2682843 RepID=A0A6L6XLX7_9ACTN|nr:MULTISPECIES: hypothetical protein [unclassified Nocardioides]MBA2953403.1 hypothetical protein [Nocardioides sp. CGMCC 1.13656]MVQ48271.1 hypothetical protein [Nocardioides sp. MAH-18]